MAITAVLLGAFVTAFYSFRLLYLTFFGAPRWHDQRRTDYVVPEADSSEHEAALAHEHERSAHDDHDHHAPRAARIAVGGDAAADPAGDPVGR